MCITNKYSRRWAGAFILFSSLVATLMAQQAPITSLFAGSGAASDSASASGDSSCLSPNVASIPSRPTVTSATDTTQCGAMEVEYGLERQWPGSGANRDELSGGLRLGLSHNLDLHWSSGDFVHLMNGDGNRTGYGDNWLGLRYRFIRQTKARPSLGLFYAAKIPSASVAKGLGSGQVDHSISFLASKDIRKLHFDFNAIELLAGRQTVPRASITTPGSRWQPGCRSHTVSLALWNLMASPSSTQAIRLSLPSWRVSITRFNRVSIWTAAWAPASRMKPRKSESS